MINLITNSLLGDNILYTFLQKAIQGKFIILDNIVYYITFMSVLCIEIIYI